MKTRIDALDVCKGMGMILVILGHMLLLGPIRNWVLSFYMPMFVVVSGVLFSRKTLWGHVRGILIPYYALGIACVLIYDGIFQPTLLKQEFIALAMGCNALRFIVYAAAPLWFLSMLFVLRCIYDLIDWLLRPMWLQTLAVLALGALGCYMAYRRLTFDGVYNIDLALVLLPFFHGGRLLGKKRVAGVSGWEWWKLVGATAALGAGSVALSRINGGYDMFVYGIGGNPLLFYVTAFLGSGFMLMLSFLICKAAPLKRALTAVGTRTLYLLPIHYPMTLLADQINQSRQLGVKYSILEFFIVLGVSLAIAMLIEWAASAIKSRRLSAARP